MEHEASANDRTIREEEGTLPAAVAAVLALFFTWRRLFAGVDLQDESYYVLVPWRWALGDRPFLQEQNLLQVPGPLTYPFVKLFGVLCGYDATGLMLYTRHLYLLLMIVVAVVAFLFLRRLLRWPLALPAAAACGSYIYWATPQLCYNTMALAFLTLSATLGAWVVVAGGRRRLALASGACLGVACVAYPTLLFIVPFWAVLLAFAHGRRATGMIAEGALMHPPDPPGPPTGPAAWRALSAWTLGGALVIIPICLVVLSFGPHELVRAWGTAMAGAKILHQLGGGTKAFDVAQGFARFLAWRPYMLVAAVGVYLVYRRWPSGGRTLLAAVPLALWLAAQRPQLWGAGYVIVYALLAPYLYLFIPKVRRIVGAQSLICVWAPALAAGAMTGYTSASGYLDSAVGLAPAVVAGGLFLCWALEAVVGEERSVERSERAAAGPPPAAMWLPLAVLIAVLAVTVGFQFEFQQRAVPRGSLTSRIDGGPSWGIKATPRRHALLDTFAVDLRAQARSGDALLVFSRRSGYYLYWEGPIAANSYSLQPRVDGQLPQPTISFYRRHRIVPTLVVHLTPTAGRTGAELTASCGGLQYPPTLVRPTYALQRMPAAETTLDVLAGLPRR